jgi:signal transduction histidine kinase
LHIPGAQLDPEKMTNWVRMGGTFGCLAALLTTAIDYVIRHVEESSRAKTRALADLRVAYERLALLHERLDAAKEDERRFIAHELHDELGQVLTVVKLRLRGAPADEGRVETVALIDQAIDRVRKISSDLRPPLLDEIGLVPALRAYVDAQAALSGVKIELETKSGDGEDRLPADLETAGFRVVQESLTNALRHGSPHNIRVRALRDNASLALTISDDGRGFDPATLDGAGNGHLGVLGMRERVRARAGTFTIDSQPGNGTRVEVRMPIH